MKKAFFTILIILPLLSMAQCPKWLGNNISVAKTLLPKVHEFLQFDLKRIGDTTQNERITYSDDQYFCTFIIRSKIAKELKGTTLVSLPPVVDNIFITGPSDRIDKLFLNLKDEVSKCEDYKMGGQWLQFKGGMIVWQSIQYHRGIPMKSISIEIKK